MATIHKLPSAMTDSELLDALGVTDAPLGVEAAPEERRARWASLRRDCEARRARAGFRIIRGAD